MAEKNYETFRERIQAFKNFVTAQGWTIVAEKEIDYGYQITVSDGITKNPIDFFPSGVIGLYSLMHRLKLG